MLEYRSVRGTGVKATRLLPKQKTDGSSPLCRSSFAGSCRCALAVVLVPSSLPNHRFYRVLRHRD